MPRYFFDMNDGDTQHRDEIGIKLISPDAIADEVLDLLRDLVHLKMPEGCRLMTATVRDEQNVVVYRGELRINGQRFRS